MIVQKVNVPHMGVKVVQPEAAAVADWWDPNGAGLCIVAAYRAINTPGNPWPNDEPGVYADTLVNNANPGVNDLVELAGAVPWVVNIGWQFNALLLQAFDTGVVPDGNYTMLIQFANNAIAGRTVAGVNTIAPFGNGFYIRPDDGAARVAYFKGNNQPVAPVLVTGNLCMGSMVLAGYRNGNPEAGAHAWLNPQVWSIYIGARNNGPAIGQACTADIESVAIYNCILTNAQVLAVVTAMSQL